jgi:prepilin-type N-terminal cleavage/methylation domain-containing protein
MRRGVTLLELLIGLVLVGLVAAVVAPRLVALHDGAKLRQEAIRLVMALDRARGTAVRRGLNARLTLTSADYVIDAALPDTLLEVWRVPGPGASAVQLGGAGAPILFGPAGVAVGVSNRTLVLTAGSTARRIVLSRLGRITW